MARAIVHIGFNKTGSTTLQDFLEANADALEREGYRFDTYRANPKWIGNTHAELVAWISEEIGILCPNFSTRHTLRISNRNDQKRVVTEFLYRLQASTPGKDETVLFSSELLLIFEKNRDWLKVLKSCLEARFSDVRILAYIRRQEHWIVSHFSQIAKYGEAISLEALVENAAFYDFNTRLQAWEDVFGAETIDLRLTAPDLLDGSDLTDDFAAYLGFNGPFKRLERPKNVSPSAAALAILQKCDACRPAHLNVTYPNPYLRDLRRAIDAVDQNFDQPRLTRRQLDRVRSNSQEGNEALRKRYLENRLELFPALDWPEDDIKTPDQIARLSGHLLSEAAAGRLFRLSARDRLELLRHKLTRTRARSRAA